MTYQTSIRDRATNTSIDPSKTIAVINDTGRVVTVLIPTGADAGTGSRIAHFRSRNTVVLGGGLPCRSAATR